MGEWRPGAVVLVRVALAGALLMSATAFVAFLHLPVLPVHGLGFWDHVWAYRLRAMVFLFPFATGLCLCVWAERRFKRGYGADLWTEADLARVRELLKPKVWRLICGGLLLLWIAGLWVQHSMHGGLLWYALLLPSQTVQRIRSLISPRAERSEKLTGFRSFGRLESEHWGER